MAQPRPLARPCNTCRARRVKCDATRPVCQRCTAAARTCVYPTDFDLAHRDETRRTQRRVAREAAATSAPAPAPATTKATAMTTAVFVAGTEVDAQTAAAAATGSQAVWRRVRRRAGARAASALPSASAASSSTHSASSSSSTSPLVPSASTSPHDLSALSSSSSSSSPPHPTPPPAIPIGQLALGYFAANFMLMPHTPTAGGFFEYLVPVLRGQPPDSSLQFALRACAFAALGNRWQSDTLDLHAIALSQYTAALTRTTRLLNDPRENKNDATLATVLLLGLFEAITDRKELVAWQSHVVGAVHLVHSRGPRRVQTRTEQLLFNAVRLQLFIHALTADVPQAVDINWYLAEHVIDAATARCQRFALETGHLRVEFDRHVHAFATAAPHLRDSAPFHAFLQRVDALDREMTGWMASAAPPHFRYRATAALAGEPPDGDYASAAAFPGRIDVYPSLDIANLWNLVRACRLISSSFVVRCLALLASGAAGAPPTDYRLTSDYAAVVRRCNSLISDILASVPYYLETVPRPSSGAPTTSLSPLSSSSPPLLPQSGFACGADPDGGGPPVPKALAGLLVIWPMTAAYTHDCATRAQRAYLAGRLRYVGHTLGVRHAHACARSTLRYPSMLVYRDRQTMAAAAAAATQPGAPPPPPPAHPNRVILQLRSPNDAGVGGGTDNR